MRHIWRLILIGVILFAARPLAAQTAPPISGASSAAYEFGQVMEFRLDITGEHQITAVTLFIAAEGFPQTAVVELEFDPARELTALYQLDLTQLRLTPFSQISYWWTAVDRRGNEWHSPEQVLDYVDDQFAWRRLERDNVTVHWANDDAALGQTALDIVAASLPRLQDIIRADAADPIQIYIYPSLADLRAALRLTGRDWIGAHAQPDLGVILVVAANPRTAGVDLRQSIPHEMSHLLLYQAMGIYYTAVPHWFDEGLATFFETEPNHVYEQLLATAVVEGATFPFADLCRQFPEEEAEVALAYAQSGSLIQFIEMEYGRQALRDLIAAFNDGADCQTAPRRVFDLSLTELEREWLHSFQPPSRLVRFFQQNGLLLLLLFSGFGLAGLLFRSPSRV